MGSPPPDRRAPPASARNSTPDTGRRHHMNNFEGLKNKISTFSTPPPPPPQRDWRQLKGIVSNSAENADSQSSTCYKK
jgi:hypothetical protein